MIFDYQQTAFAKLLTVGRACFSANRNQIAVVNPRTNTLLIGESGSGKSHLVRTVTRSLSAPSLILAASEWILLGCTERGASNTWPMILRFLMDNAFAKGVVIFVDEIDKINGTTSWDQHLRNELFQLLDLRVPHGIKDDEDMVPDDVAAAERLLKERTFIVGAGAFQHLWIQDQQPSIGFNECTSQSKPKSLSELAKTLPTELVNRFRADIVILPMLKESDYAAMLEQAADALPTYLRTTFLRLGRQRLSKAFANRQACRFLEELALDTVIEQQHMIDTMDATSEQPSADGPDSSVHAF